MAEPKLYKDYMDPRKWAKTSKGEAEDEKPDDNILPYFKDELGSAPEPEPGPIEAKPDSDPEPKARTPRTPRSKKATD